MAVKIRLTRTGATNDACYRVVATDTKFPRDGRFIETLGWYDPTRKGETFNLKMDRIDYWTKHGAIQSDTVKTLVGKAMAKTA